MNDCIAYKFFKFADIEYGVNSDIHGHYFLGRNIRIAFSAEYIELTAQDVFNAMCKKFS